MSGKKKALLITGIAAGMVLAVLLALHYCSQPAEPSAPSTQPTSLTGEVYAAVRSGSPAPQAAAADPADMDTGAGSASVSYSDQVAVSGGTARLYFANPEGSGSDMRLSVYAGDTLIGTSDMIHPGETVTAIAVDTTDLQPGVMAGQFVVDHFNEAGAQSYFSLSIDTVVEISE